MKDAGRTKRAKKPSSKKSGDGGDLAKVLVHLGLIPDVSKDKRSILCPIHDDINPSMTADIVKGTWYCFGCGRGGDAYELVKAICAKHHPDYDDLRVMLEYVRILKADDVRAIKINARAKPQMIDGKELEAARRFYDGLSTTDWTAPGEDVKDALSYMVGRGFTPEIMNIVGAKACYKKDYPIIFPLMDNREFCGWVCRTDNKKAEDRAKYLYNTGFSRNTTLCGRYDKGKPLVVVEGYLDMLKMRQYGLKNVVALLGWKCSAMQLQKIKDAEIPYIICALDNDPCGKKGYEHLKSVYPTYRWAYLKGIKDAGDMDEQKFGTMYKRTKQKIKEKRMKDGAGR